MSSSYDTSKTVKFRRFPQSGPFSQICSRMRYVTCVRTGEVGVVGGVDEVVVEGLVHVVVLVQVDHIQYVLTHQVLH